MAETTSPTFKITTPSDLEIVMTRVFDAPAALVFDAWTQCEHLKRWFGPRSWSLPECEIDLRVGGKWRYLMRNNDGMEMGMHGEYREVQRPTRLVSTEMFEGDEFEAMEVAPSTPWTLEERDGKTTMTVTALYKSKEARDGVMQTGMEEGAAESFDRLEELLSAMS